VTLSCSRETLNKLLTKYPTKIFANQRRLSSNPLCEMANLIENCLNGAGFESVVLNAENLL